MLKSRRRGRVPSFLLLAQWFGIAMVTSIPMIRITVFLPDFKRGELGFHTLLSEPEEVSEIVNSDDASVPFR
jgi:hypothetical protein